MNYRFKQGDFEGPLGLLLELTRAKKLSISTLSLSQITDEYVTYLKGLDQFPRAEVAEFLVIASTLMLIKSRALLPELELTEGEEESISDLETRLKILKRLRDLSAHIKSAWLASPLFSREAFLDRELGFIEPGGLTVLALKKAMENLIASFPKLLELPQKTIEKVISIEEKMVELVERISIRMKSAFHEMVSSKNKMDVIVGFLAVLELVKQGALLVAQDERFGRINLEKEEKML